MTKISPKALNRIFTVMLDPMMTDLITKEAEYRGSSKGYVIRQALKEYFKNKKEGE